MLTAFSTRRYTQLRTCEMRICCIYSTIYIKYLKKLKRALFGVDVSIISVGEHQVIRNANSLISTTYFKGANHTGNLTAHEVVDLKFYCAVGCFVDK